MLVVGLPTAVGETPRGPAEGELQQTSRKVSREGSKTVVVLRLTALTTMSEHNIQTMQQHRQKPTSQQNRERKRAEECNRRLKQKLRQTDALKNQQADDFLDSGFELFAQTSEYRAHQHEHRDVHEIAALVRLKRIPQF